MTPELTRPEMTDAQVWLVHVIDADGREWRGAITAQAEGMGAPPVQFPGARTVNLHNLATLKALGA